MEEGAGAGVGFGVVVKMGVGAGLVEVEAGTPALANALRRLWAIVSSILCNKNGSANSSGDCGTMSVETHFSMSWTRYMDES